jgi:hypothetical protein
MVMRVTCAENAPKVQTVLPPVLPRDFVKLDNPEAQAASMSDSSTSAFPECDCGGEQ